MQPTTLNKIASLFLVGGLVIIGIALLVLQHAGPISVPQGVRDLASTGGDGLFAVIGALLLLPVTALAGAVCESLTDSTVRRLIKFMMREKVLIQFFCQSKVYGSHGFWKARFSEVTQETIWLRNLPDFGNDHGLAVAILYCKDREPAITWAESHYATYILVSNFAFLALAAQIYLLVAGFRGWFEWPGIGWASLAVVTVLYSTLGLALDRYLYTYQVAMRQATVLLLMDPVAPEGLGPANEGADLGGGSRAPRRRSRK